MGDYMKEWYKLNIGEVISSFESNINGLDEKEALSRLKKYGKNVLPKGKKDTLFKVFIRQFNNPIYILIATIILSLFIGELVDALFIVVVILLDSILGTIQEWKAEKVQNLYKI